MVQKTKMMAAIIALFLYLSISESFSSLIWLTKYRTESQTSMNRWSGFSMDTIVGLCEATRCGCVRRCG